MSDWRPEWADADPETWKRIHAYNKFRSAVLAYFKGVNSDLTHVQSALEDVEHSGDYDVCAKLYQALLIDATDEAKRLYLDLPSHYPAVTNENDGSDDLWHFLELANEIRNRIEANPDGWWKDICQLSEQLEESRKLICPSKAWGFILTRDSRIDASSAEHIEKQNEQHPDLDCGTLAKDATGFVLHHPSQPMTDGRRIAANVLSQTTLWICDPYEDGGSVSVVETLCGPLGGELTDVRTPASASEALSSLDKWIRFVESRLRIWQTTEKLQAATSSLSIPEIGPATLPDDFADSIVRPGESVGALGNAENKLDDDLPRKQRKLSPSRVKAQAAHDYAMERIEGAKDMTLAELHAAILEDDEVAAMVPKRADTFGRYLRDCGINRYKLAPKSSGGSVVDQSDLD